MIARVLRHVPRRVDVDAVDRGRRAGLRGADDVDPHGGDARLERGERPLRGLPRPLRRAIGVGRLRRGDERAAASMSLPDAASASPRSSPWRGSGRASAPSSARQSRRRSGARPPPSSRTRPARGRGPVLRRGRGERRGGQRDEHERDRGDLGEAGGLHDREGNAAPRGSTRSSGACRVFACSSSFPSCLSRRRRRRGGALPGEAEATLVKTA